MPSAVYSLTSLCLGMVTGVEPHRQSSCCLPCRTMLQVSPRAAATTAIRRLRSRCFTDL